MPNTTRKGIRWAKGAERAGLPAYEYGRVASAYGTALYEGQPVTRVDGGTFQVCAGGTAAIYGIIAGIVQYYDGSRLIKPLQPSPKYLPASTTYTGTDNESIIQIIPVLNQYFWIQGNAILATPTYAGAVALLGSNGDHVVSTDDCVLSVSDVEAKDASAAAAQWQLVDFDRNGDPTATRLDFLVRCNEPQFLVAGAGL